MQEVKKANEKLGQHFFNKETLQFFGSRILPKIYNANNRQFFITIEDNFDRSAKYYSIREVLPDGDIETLGKFLQFESLEDAVFALGQFVNEVNIQLAK